MDHFEPFVLSYYCYELGVKFITVIAQIDAIREQDDYET